MKQILVMKCGKPAGENSEEINQHVEKIVKQSTSKKFVLSPEQHPKPDFRAQTLVLRPKVHNKPHFNVISSL